MNNNALSNCNYVRLILLLIVVLYHSILFWHGGWLESLEGDIVIPLYYFAEWLNSFHIYAFTLVSGFVYGYIIIDRKGYTSFSYLLKSKLLRLLIPYVVVSLFWAIPNDVFIRHSSFHDIFINYLLGQSPAQLWFILMLFGVFVVSYPFNRIFIKSNLICFIITFVLFCLGTVLSLCSIGNVFQCWSVLQYLLFFWLGVKYYQYRGHLIGRIHPVLWIVFDILLFVLFEFYPSDTILNEIIHFSFGFLLRIVGAIGAFEVLNAIASSFSLKGTVFAFLSRRGMIVYLIHQQLIYYPLLWFSPQMNPYLNAGINFIFSLIVSLIIASLVLSNKVTTILFGEKWFARN